SKVPRALPNPADPRLQLIPASNRPTLGKWELGKRLFFDKSILRGKDQIACATCHIPGEGYTERAPRAMNGPYNTLSLINCVYNKHQFWDGRATFLEEVIQRTLEDERPSPNRLPEQVHHVWSGVVERLNDNETYKRHFKR